MVFAPKGTETKNFQAVIRVSIIDATPSAPKLVATDFDQAGLIHKNEEDHSFSAYRFHDLDPILFSDRIRRSCRCGEKRRDGVLGTTAHPQPTTFTSYVWTYER